MATDDRAAILTAAIEAIPTLPVVVSRVMEITANPESGVQELMEAISIDPVLTAKVLKIANSAFYSRSGQIATLRQALVVIGFNEVRNLVLSSAVFNNFAKLSRAPGFDAHLFWRHSFVTGLACRMMARPMGLPGGESFVAGLIHDIGKLVMVMALPLEFTKMMKMTGNFGLEHVVAEKHLLGLTHEEVGLRLLKRWAFPQHLQSAVGYHHHPALANVQVAQALAVHLADLLAHINDRAQAIPDDNLLPEGCFGAETAALARTHGIEWNPEAVRKHVDSLDHLITEQSSVLDIFLA
ncbi:MAG: HDOD domain-containing protein [Desulfobacterales bacterium]|nr:HDOD domain-containing protein [Desulfobacterales bacterium]